MHIVGAWNVLSFCSKAWGGWFTFGWDLGDVSRIILEMGASENLADGIGGRVVDGLLICTWSPLAIVVSSEHSGRKNQDATEAHWNKGKGTFIQTYTDYNTDIKRSQQHYKSYISDNLASRVIAILLYFKLFVLDCRYVSNNNLYDTFYHNKTRTSI